MDIENFEKHKELAETFYKQVGKTYCPALKADVHFNAKGFHHLRYNNPGSERDKQIQLRKFRLLKTAVEIIKKTTTLQFYRASLEKVGTPGRDGFTKTSRVQYFGFTNIIGERKNIRVRTIVRIIGDGFYHFWSVMPDWREKRISEGQVINIVGDKEMEDE